MNWRVGVTIHLVNSPTHQFPDWLYWKLKLNVTVIFTPAAAGAGGGGAGERAAGAAGDAAGGLAVPVGDARVGAGGGGC